MLVVVDGVVFGFEELRWLEEWIGVLWWWFVVMFDCEGFDVLIGFVYVCFVVLYGTVFEVVVG